MRCQTRTSIDCSRCVLFVRPLLHLVNHSSLSRFFAMRAATMRRTMRLPRSILLSMSLFRVARLITQQHNDPQQTLMKTLASMTVPIDTIRRLLTLQTSSTLANEASTTTTTTNTGRSRKRPLETTNNDATSSSTDTATTNLVSLQRIGNLIEIIAERLELARGTQ
jgi:hypothetical protein